MLTLSEFEILLS